MTLKLTEDQIKHASLSDLLDWTNAALEALSGNESYETKAVALGLVKRQKGGGVKPTKLYRILTEAA